MAIRGITVPKISAQAGNPRLYEALKDIVSKSSDRANEIEEIAITLGGQLDVLELAFALVADNHNLLGGRSVADSHPASSVTFTPYSTIAATNVQAAIQEVLDELPAPVAGVPSGSISMYAGSAAPSGYLLCDGSVVSQATYAALYAVCGATYNTGGEGAGNFRLPNMRQRFPLGKAAAGPGSTLGGSGGAIDHVHTADPLGTASGGPSSTVSICQDNVVGWAADGSHTHTTDIASFNTGTANPPFLALNFIIKT